MLRLISLEYGCAWRDRHTCEPRDTPTTKRMRGLISENEKDRGIGSWSLEIAVIPEVPETGQFPCSLRSCRAEGTME